MIQRCTNPKATEYENYGARGIKVCKRWRVFANFVADMGIRPDGKTLDRKDHNGNYCKSNCRWSTNKVQQNNKRTNVAVLLNGKKYTVPEAAVILGYAESTVYNKMRAGELTKVSRL